MGKTVFDISMSLDGFITASNQTPEEPMGDGGERLHEWAFGSDEASRRFLERAVGGLGAVICGRRTYDTLAAMVGRGRPERARPGGRCSWSRTLSRPSTRRAGCTST